MVNTHGGHRTPGPGKNPGRPKKTGFKSLKTFRFSSSAEEKIIDIMTPEERTEACVLYVNFILRQADEIRKKTKSVTPEQRAQALLRETEKR